MEGNQREQPENKQETLSTQKEDARRREEAIRSLAAGANDAEVGQSSSSRASPFQGNARRHYPRRMIAVIAVVIIVMLILVGVYARNQVIGRVASKLPHSAPTTLRIDLTALGYSCPAAMAWSPDGSKLAVLAQHGPITPDQSCIGDTLLIFDTQRGTLLEHLDFSTTLKTANASLTERHDTPSWSPDATMLALPCLVATRTPAHPVDPGVLLIPLSGAKPFIIHAAVSPALQNTFLNGDVTTVWDTRSRSLASATTLPLPPALGYTLDSAGRLVVAQPLSAQAGADTLTASPGAQTGAVRSLWQAGALIVVEAFQGQTSANQPTATPSLSRPSLVFYNAALGLWSSDGRFVDPQVTLGSVGFPEDAQALAKFDPQSCVHYGLALCEPHAVPYPDRALQVVKNKLLAQSGAQPYAADAPVAWSPDGAVLATIFPLNSFTTTNDAVRVTLLSTHDGSVLKTLSARTSSSSDSGEFDDLSWSPTGSQLAFRDAYSAAITLWGGSSLDGLS